MARRPQETPGLILRGLLASYATVEKYKDICMGEKKRFILEAKNMNEFLNKSHPPYFSCVFLASYVVFRAIPVSFSSIVTGIAL